MTQAELIDRESKTSALLHLDPRDDVAVALRPLAAGERLEADGRTITLAEDVPDGHKVALRAMQAGETVRKYGWPIGQLTENVAEGAHVHTHNLTTLLKGVEGYRYEPTAA